MRALHYAAPFAVLLFATATQSNPKGPQCKSVGSGAILETLSDGTALLASAVTNSGILFANGVHSLILPPDQPSPVVVMPKIANGIVDIEGTGDNQNVVFQSGGTGGFDIGVLGSAYTGVVSGFGQNVHHFIDFTAINSVEATFSCTSTSSSSRVLTVMNGGTSASIDLSGRYTSASFHISSGTGGTVEIADPRSPIRKRTSIPAPSPIWGTLSRPPPMTS